MLTVSASSSQRSDRVQNRSTNAATRTRTTAAAMTARTVGEKGGPSGPSALVDSRYAPPERSGGCFGSFGVAGAAGLVLADGLMDASGAVDAIVEDPVADPASDPVADSASDSVDGGVVGPATEAEPGVATSMTGMVPSAGRGRETFVIAVDRMTGKQ